MLSLPDWICPDLVIGDKRVQIIEEMENFRSVHNNLASLVYAQAQLLSAHLQFPSFFLFYLLLFYFVS